MINRTEEEIKKNWTLSSEMPIVTVRCTAYNHERFIERALDSFLSQETTFPFEILIHDDASTDKTAVIIHDYAFKYPSIIKPIYENENQYSKKDGSLRRIMDSATHGKYVALCEGDDYWCDPQKLQTQWLFMEENEACSMCVHNSYFHYLGEAELSKTFNSWNEVHKMTEDDIFFGWHVHTSSYFYRNKYNFSPKFRVSFWSGDYAQLTLALYYGDVFCLPEIMSVYNAGNPAGLTVQNNIKGYEHRINSIRSRITYLESYNEYTEGKFQITVKARIAEDTLKISEDEAELVEAANDMVKSTYYSDVLLKQGVLTRLKSIWKYKGHVFRKLWLVSIKKRHRGQASRMEQNLVR